jgi:pilus assembly protein Flp/PilA
MLTKFAAKVVDFLKAEDGPTAVEYAVMLALIIVVCLAAIQILGKNANSAFGTVGASIGATVTAGT